jgi:hypothetical protein
VDRDRRNREVEQSIEKLVYLELYSSFGETINKYKYNENAA